MAGGLTKKSQHDDGAAAPSGYRRWCLLNLDDVQADRLRRLKWYRSGCSLMEPTMDRFWKLVLSYIPLHVAPNLITMIGCLVLLAASLPILMCNTDAAGQYPAFAYVACAAGIFIYQLCDALDGKQARRTGNVSPLGALCDWVADSTTAVFIALTACLCLNVAHLGTTLLVFLPMIFVTGFYAASWESCMYGVYQFDTFDDVETELIMIGMHLCTALFGATIWDTRLPLLFCEQGLSLRVVMLVVLWLPVVNTIVRQLVSTCKHAYHRTLGFSTDSVNGQNCEDVPRKQKVQADRVHPNVNGCHETSETERFRAATEYVTDDTLNFPLSATDSNNTVKLSTPANRKACLCQKHFRDPHGVIYPVLHPLVAFAGAFLLVVVARDTLDHYPVLFSVLACLPIAKANDMHVVSTSTADKTCFSLLDYVWLGHVTLLIGAALHLPCGAIVWIAFSLCTTDYVYWHIRALLDMAMYLDVPLLTIRSDKQTQIQPQPQTGH